MGLNITVPFRNTAGDNVKCDFFAVGTKKNPLNVVAQRRDFTIIDAQDDGFGNVILSFAGPLPTINTTDKVYVAAGTFPYGYFGEFEVLSATSTTVVIDFPFVTAVAGGYMNLITGRKNYRIVTKIMHIYPQDQFLDNGLIFHEFRRDFPDAKGKAEINLQPNLSIHFPLENTSDYTLLSWTDNANVRQYEVTFYEEWEGQEMLFVQAEYINAVNAAMQVQNKGGTCMVEYMTTDAANDKAKFLTGSARMRMWLGMPFDLSFIVSSNVIGGSNVSFLSRHLVEYANGSVVTFADTGLSTTSLYDQWIQRMTLPQSGYDPTTDRINVAAYFSNLPTNITQEVQIRLERIIPCNPVYLCWLDKTGGWNYFMFSKRQLKGRKTSAGVRFKKSYLDMELQNSTSRLLSKESAPYFQCGSDRLDAYDMLLMKSLMESNYVTMLMNPLTVNPGTVAPVWQEVEVEAADYKGEDTSKVYQNFELKVFEVESIIQTN